MGAVGDVVLLLTLLIRSPPIPGKIRHVGVTNFDAPALAAALEQGLPVVSNTVQYSILDQRPARELTDLCLHRNVKLLCYGTLLGGFLTDRWLGVELPPDPRAFTSGSEEKVRASFESVESVRVRCESTTTTSMNEKSH